MATQFVAKIVPWISTDRLEAYRPIGGSDREMVVSYLFNLALNEGLYTPLSFLEIALRNTLHSNLSASFESAAWYDIPGILKPTQVKSVSQVKTRIAGLTKPVTPGRVVSELNFGFWVSLMSADYDATIWRPNRGRVLKAAFLNIPRPMRQRKSIYGRYNRLRELRNRVFHHESIWNRPTLWQDYLDICEAIDWISPDIGTACRMVSRFDRVFHNGRVEIETMLANNHIV